MADLKIVVVELLPKMFLANQIAGFFKTYYVEKIELSVWLFVCRQSFLQVDGYG